MSTEVCKQLFFFPYEANLAKYFAVAKKKFCPRNKVVQLLTGM